jgi:hypothetical protein
MRDPYSSSSSSSGWRCPECQRQFGRRNQSHECAPGLSFDEYFSTGSQLERQIFDTVYAHLNSVGPLSVEFLSVGIFFKRVRTFAELRPKRDRARRARIELSILLSRVLKDPRVARTWRGPGVRSAYFIDLYDATEVDDVIRDWLTEAYAASPA